MEIKSEFVLLFGLSFIAKIVLHYWVDKLESNEKPRIDNFFLEKFVTGLKLKILLPFYLKLNKNESKEINLFRNILRFSIFMIYFSLIVGFYYSYRDV